MESHFSFLGQVMLPDDSFAISGVDDFPTKLQFWQKKSTAADWTPKRYSTDCADIYIPSGHPVMAATALYEKFVMVAKADLAGNRNKVFLELAQLKTTKSTFLYQVKKYLYQIRSHPVTREKYDACFSYVHRFYTQRQPGDMPYEEWQRVQLTEAKVLTYLKQALCRQNAKPERDEIRLVKQRYSFVYKAYSRKMAKLLTDEMRAPVPIYQAVLDNKPERFPGYERLLRRKRREYDNQEQPFSEMTENAQLADWIGRFQYWDAQNHAYIHLNPLQSHDVNLTLQKRYAFLQWEQGSGKTPAAIFTGKHRVEMGAVHSIWVISSAISIRNNWDVILKGAGFSYVFVERLADLQRIRPGDFVILTLNKVSQYKKQIGRYIKQLGYKIQFIFDESDNISNPSSKQTLSVLSCFRRCKYKLLTTGTSTRNNISEFAPQLELLYNNSINMISWCRTLYSYDKRSADMEHKENPYYAMPIPAYKKGYRLFANSHLPEKITVFGVGQRNQDIYNADELDRLLGKTVITRTFEEVTGKDIRRIHQMPIPFLPEEREVYNIVLKEFYRIQREYYSSTGNSRKDALMRLIQQITLLLRISAAPDCMKEYEGETPLKEVAVVEALARWPEEVVAIGVRHTTVLDRYAAAIREYLPDRPLFVVSHQRGEQVIIHTEFGIDLVHIRVLPLHKHGELFLCQHHLHEVGFQTSYVDGEIQILFLRGGVADESHIKLAHAGVVVVHLRNDDLVDELEVDTGGKALLRAEQDAVPTVPQYIPAYPLGRTEDRLISGKEQEMDKFYIELYPKADLENEWAKNKHTPGAMPCMRCGGPMRESLAENALSRALNVYVCPACGMDEALRDAAGKVLPISEWYAVKQHRLAEHKNPQTIKLMPVCAFTEIFSGARKTLPLSSARYPTSLVAYSRSDYDGWRWWTTWFPDEEMRPAPELGQEIDAFQSQLLALPEDLRRAHLDGDWDVHAGQYFREFSREKHVVAPFEIPHWWRRFRSMDWGYNDPCCVLWHAADGEGRVFTYRELYVRQTRQGEKLLHIIRIGIHKNPVVIDFCGNEIVILCIFTLLILSVDKQPLHPCMADVAGVACVIHARRNIRSCRAVAGRQKPHLFFRKMRCFFHADDCIFLPLILVNILRRVAITEFDSRPVGEPEHALG